MDICNCILIAITAYQNYTSSIIFTHDEIIDIHNANRDIHNWIKDIRNWIKDSIIEL